MPSIDIDRDAAHQAAQTRTRQADLFQGILRHNNSSTGSTNCCTGCCRRPRMISGGWFTATVLLILLAIAVVVAIHIARRTMRTNRGGDYQLFEAAQLTAAQHRATAESFAAEG